MHTMMDGEPATRVPGFSRRWRAIVLVVAWAWSVAGLVALMVGALVYGDHSKPPAWITALLVFGSVGAVAGVLYLRFASFTSFDPLRFTRRRARQLRVAARPERVTPVTVEPYYRLRGSEGAVYMVRLTTENHEWFVNTGRHLLRTLDRSQPGSLLGPCEEGAEVVVICGRRVVWPRSGLFTRDGRLVPFDERPPFSLL
jgi:hypothetical protein